MDERTTWQELLQHMQPGITIAAAEQVRDWSQSRVVKLTGVEADGSPVTIYAKLDRSSDDREVAVYRAATQLPGFPAPRANFLTGPDGAEWLMIRQARGTRLHDLPPADWVKACAELAAFHEQATHEEWPRRIGGLPSIFTGLGDLPWPILEATERCAADGPYEGLDQVALAATRRSLSAVWSDIAAEIAAYPPTLMHGDSHSGNLFLTAGGQIELIDWAGAQTGPGLLDLIGLFDTAARMHEDCPCADGLIAYRERLSADSLRGYGDFGRAVAALRVLRALTELQWFATSDDDYGERANTEFAKIADSLVELGHR